MKKQKEKKYKLSEKKLKYLLTEAYYAGISGYITTNIIRDNDCESNINKIFNKWRNDKNKKKD